MTAQLLVTVVLPTYNRAGLLAEAIASVRAQTFADWELIVVDDGSIDGTAAMLRADADPRLRVVTLAHTGSPAAARNAGLEAARGTWIAFLDDDDTWMPDKLALQLASARASGRRWSYTAFERVDKDGLTLHGDTQAWRPLDGDILEPLLRIEAVIATPTVLVERALLVEAGGHDASLRHCADYELWFRLAARCPVHVDARPLARVRVHSATHTAGREAVHRSWVTVYEKVMASSTDQRIVRIAQTRRAHHIANLARHAAARGDRREAVGYLAAAWPRLWSHAFWWRALARVIVPAQ